MKKFNVFVASPGDVVEERDIVSMVVEEISRTIGDILQVHLQTIKWETHAWPDIGEDAQDVINKEIGDYDIFVGIMWKRFGTPTKRSASGTGEEFERAYQYFMHYQRPKIMFYFRKKDFYSEDLKEISQFRKVIQFKKKLAKVGTFYWEYKEKIEFERRFREHLTRQIYRLTQKPTEEPKVKRSPIVFISYASPDRNEVENLYNSLKVAGFDPWLDIKDLKPGMRWLDALEKAIKKADYFLVCLSEMSKDRKGFFQKELKMAYDVMKRKPKTAPYIIPVRLAQVQPPKELIEFQWVDVFDSEGVQKLVNVLKSTRESEE